MRYKKAIFGIMKRRVFGYLFFIDKMEILEVSLSEEEKAKII